jgi:3-oxoacyl-[acyl-carrier protein] reductase
MPDTKLIPAPLAGKIALVTGGSRGIGAVIARVLARQGCSHIAITYAAKKSGAEATLQKIKEVHPDVITHAFQAELTDPNFGECVVKEAMKGLKTDHLDIMVSNAGITDIKLLKPVASLTKEEWDMVMTAEAWAPLALAREAYERMSSDSHGRIIFISGGQSRLAAGDPFVTSAMAKSALEAAARNLGRVYAQKGVTVNSIGVGPTATETMVGPELEAANPGHKEMAASLPVLGRLGTMEEVAEIVAFVASPQASWMTSKFSMPLFFEGWWFRRGSSLLIVDFAPQATKYRRMVGCWLRSSPKKI